MGAIERKKEINRKWRENNPDYFKKWHEAHPNYSRDHYRQKHEYYLKNMEDRKEYYQKNRIKILDYYSKRNSSTATKLLVKNNLKALSQMPLADLFLFQSLHMKSVSPVALGSFFYALKQLLENNKIENDK